MGGLWGVSPRTFWRKWPCYDKANLRDLIAATGLVILLKFDPNHRFFSPCDIEIWCMTSKNNRAPLLYYIKLCVSFRIHRWIQTVVTLRKHSIRVEIGDFLSLVTLKFDRWPWKTIGTSSIVHQALCIISNPSVNWNWSYTPETLNLGQNGQFFVLCDLEIWWMTLENNRAPLLYYIKLCTSFKSIGEFKLELQSGNAQFGSKSAVFCPVWPWNLTDDLEQGKSEGFESCDRPIVRKRPIWVKFGDVLSRVTLKFDGWHWKTIGHLFYATSSFVHHFLAIGDFKLELQSGNTQFGSNSTIFRAVWPWNLTDDLEKQ